MKYDAFLKNQKKVIKLFTNSIKKNRLVHTYLFEGAKGTGTLDGAYYLAQMLLCENKDKAPCMECENCRKVMNEVHPSIFLVSSENEVIKKEQIDKLEKEFSLTPLGAGKRIYIIQDIEKANASAANSLLKFLEELEGDKYGILLTEHLNSVIPTIRSRSQIIFFDMLPQSVIVEELIAKGVDEETSNILSHLTNSVDDCLALINEGKVLDYIELVKSLMVALIKKDSSPLLILNQQGEELLKENNKKYHNLFLDLLLLIVNDQLNYILNQLDKIVFKDTMAVIGLDINTTYDKVVSEIEKILEFKERLKYNINIELFYTQLIIEMSR